MSDKPMVDKEQVRKRASSGRGFKNGAQMKKDKAEKENNPDYAPSNQ
jgi:hypothetical protein